MNPDVWRDFTRFGQLDHVHRRPGIPDGLFGRLPRAFGADLRALHPGPVDRLARFGAQGAALPPCWPARATPPGLDTGNGHAGHAIRRLFRVTGGIYMPNAGRLPNTASRLTKALRNQAKN